MSGTIKSAAMDVMVRFDAMSRCERDLANEFTLELVEATRGLCDTDGERRELLEEMRREMQADTMSEAVKRR